MGLLTMPRIDLFVIVVSFTIGLVVGAVAPFPHSLWIAPLAAPFALSFSAAAVGSLYFADFPFHQIPATGFWWGVFLLILGGPAIAAFVGSWAWLKLA